MNCKFKFFINEINCINNKKYHYLLDRYISAWYFVPLKVQKILLLIMIRSSTSCTFHILGVFIPCYTGFSKVIYLNNYIMILIKITAFQILSTSFSYFTMIYSIQ